MRFSSGQSVGRYIIESILGEGGMGEVYRARDSKLERAVALKVLRNDTDTDSETWELAVLRMQREAQAVAALSHPGIVAIYDIGEQDGVPFIAMELVEGRPLRDFVGKDLALDTRIRILLDVAKALGAAHDAGFVHRDIKPENILIRHDGGAKILDFGIAKKTSRPPDLTIGASGRLRRPAPETPDSPPHMLERAAPTMTAASMRMTADGALVGTPEYMAPEQFQGEIADARSDQFAWSILAYELLSGKHPFRADAGTVKVIAAILQNTPEPLVDVPSEWNAAIMRGLEKEPHKRWSSMHDLVMHCEVLGTNPDGRKVSPGPIPPSPEEVRPTNASNIALEPPSMLRWSIIAMAAVLIVALVMTFETRKTPTPQQTAVVLPSATSAPIVTKITDLPIPASTNAVAIAEFRQGLQNIHDARWGAAAVAFQKAAAADPGMAAAYLRYAVLQYSTDVGEAREAYRKALGLRASLSARDQGFLRAQEPLIMRDPADLTEGLQRLEALSKQYPGDVELVYWHANVLFSSSSEPPALQRSIELLDQCVNLDPQYADCWQLKSNSLLALGKRKEASEALDECIKRSEVSPDCILDKIKLESQSGNCKIVIDLARQLRAKEPIAPRGSRLLAQALFNHGEPEAIVRNAYAEAKQRLNATGLVFDSNASEVALAVDYGDFSMAIEKAETMSRTIGYPNIEAEYWYYWMRADLLSEIDKKQEAKQLAEEFFASRPLRSKFTSKRHIDVTVLMHAFRRRAGGITDDEYRRLRQEWVDMQPKNTNFERARTWIAAYAVPADSPDSAREALEVMPAGLETTLLNEGLYSKPFTTFHARVLTVGGKYAEALPLLEDAGRICTTDNVSLWQTQNYALLGITREAIGDNSGACQAYQVVLSRWGKSKESRTVIEVRKRARKLGC